MVENAERVRSGEVGFCEQCGRATHVLVGNEDRLQRRAARAVERRGYLAGWTWGQVALRQAAKLMEEMTELARPVRSRLPGEIWTLLEAAGSDARKQFDRGAWKHEMIDEQAAREMLRELADVQVVVYVLAEALGNGLGEPVDIARLAVEKAERDIPRGVRSDG